MKKIDAKLAKEQTEKYSEPARQLSGLDKVKIKEINGTNSRAISSEYLINKGRGVRGNN